MTQMPLINLNGSTALALAEQYSTALNALAEARRCVGECYPHGRDYQTAEDPQRALMTARIEFEEALAGLEPLERHLQLLLGYCLTGKTSASRDGVTPERARGCATKVDPYNAGVGGPMDVALRSRRGE